MGQQQLLLLVLSTVIVGLATVAGIQAFSENQQQASVDALNQQLLDYATEAQAAASKPSAMGGISDLNNASPSTLNLGSSNPISTAQGDFEFGGNSNVASDQVDCSSASGSGGLAIYAEDPTTGAQACVAVTGTDGIDDITAKTAVGS